MKNRKLLVLGIILVLVAAIISGCKIRNYDKVLININNGEDGITLGYANFVFKYNQARYDLEYGSKYGASMWTGDMTGSGETFAEEVKNDVIDTIKDQYVIRKHADEYGVTLTDEDNTKIQEATTQFLKDNSSSTLNAMGADENVVKEFFTNLTYVSKMQQAMTKKGTEEGAINDTTTSSSYISNLIESWKSGIEFSVDEDLLAQLKVGDLFTSSASSNTTNSTGTSNSTTTTTTTTNSAK
ncbi:MAG: hypothetical protein K5644_04250 [Lachnospiraceae bacterium]|nr:hypothetical protein [Lachnospiraceae bacterium]